MSYVNLTVTRRGSDYAPTRFETPTQVITKSNTHKSLWVFSDKVGIGMYAINASDTWVMENFGNIPIHPEPVKKRVFTRMRR